MIKKLYDCDCFDFERFIISHQKELLLNPSSAVVLTLMLKEYKNNKYFSVESIKEKILRIWIMTFSMLFNLFKRKSIEY